MVNVSTLKPRLEDSTPVAPEEHEGMRTAEHSASKWRDEEPSEKAMPYFMPA